MFFGYKRTTKNKSNSWITCGNFYVTSWGIYGINLVGGSEMKYHIKIGTPYIISSWDTDDMETVLENWKSKGVIIIALPDGKTVSYNLGNYNYLEITENKEDKTEE